MEGENKMRRANETVTQDGKEIIEPEQAAQWVFGKGEEGLEKAREACKESNDSLEDKPIDEKALFVVEGRLDGGVVFREEQWGDQRLPNIDNIPMGREGDVSYFNVAYNITK